MPHEKLGSMYTDVKECSDLPALLLAQIQHFFENYKALEPGKWVKMGRWGALMRLGRKFASRWLRMPRNKFFALD